ncbi:hypothetical protein D3C79_905400 [compost metagenome]
MQNLNFAILIQKRCKEEQGAQELRANVTGNLNFTAFWCPALDSDRKLAFAVLD